MSVIVEKSVMAPMRDGVCLACDVYRPAGDGRFPVLVQRTPYNKEFLPFTAATLDPIRAALAGYAVVIQDVRGRFASQGDVFQMYRHEGLDGFDTVQWAAQQPWASGVAGAYGISYMGGTAWHAAAQAPPALKAISPTTAPNDFWHDHVWRGGVLNLGLFVMWTLQGIGPAALLRARAGKPELVPDLLRLVDDIDAYTERVRDLPIERFAPARPGDDWFLPFFFETLRHPQPDAWTAAQLPSNRHAEVRVPALIIAGWHDLLLAGDLAHYAHMRSEAATPEARAATRIVIGPWSHGMFSSTVGDLDFGFRANGTFMDLREDLTGLQLRWFDRWLRERKSADEPPVRLFVQGVNRWRDENAWPLARARTTPLYLRGGGALSFDAPDSRESGHDAYAFDPNDPCPTCGGSLLMPGVYRRGPVDQSPILGRSDVLSYTGPVLERDLEVTGVVRAVLHAATSGRDTDWIVKLCDVHPDGCTYNVCDGVLRARYRTGFTAPTLVEPEAVQRYEIELGATSMVFRAGHRLRVLVTSSDFPRYDRNPGTGELATQATTLVAVRQRIFRDGVRASHLELPLCPPSA